jgi:hypothetical protein
MTVLLVLAIGASSALVFTNRVELLKLAVILALWAAVVAAFVSVIYRRQSDSDQAKVRDLKLVYDLQLEREISARREYELAVESQLRRELASEVRAQSADEVASLRAELAALRANLEYLFDADLSHRPAIETERTAGRVSSSRIDTEDDFGAAEDPYAPETDESPIIDVPAEPHPPEHEWSPSSEPVGAHRRAGERSAERRHGAEGAADPQWAPPPQPAQAPSPQPPPPPPPQRPPPQAPAPAPQFPWLPPQATPQPPQPTPQPQPPRPPSPERAPEPAPAASRWQPAPAEGQWIPPGEPGSNWVAPPATDAHDEYVGRRRAPEPPSEPQDAGPQPAEPPRGRHSAAGEQPSPPPAVEEPAEPDADGGAHAGGQPVADLMARLQASPSGGGRRRRRED